MSPNLIPFIIVFIIALAVFAFNLYRRFHLLTLGKPEKRTDHIGRRIWSALFFAFGQRRVVTKSYRFGLNHAIFFSFFWIIAVANIVLLLSALFPAYIGLSKLSNGANFTISFIFDIVWVLSLVCMFIALARRAFFRPSYILPIKSDALITLTLFFAMMVSFFGMNGVRIAQGDVTAARFMPVSSFAASLFSGASAASLSSTFNVFFWIFSLALLGFMNYLALTKHMHIVTAIPNVFMRSFVKVNTQPREEFKKEKQLGAGRVDQFTWKSLYDTYSCTDCRRCSDVCPAYFTGKPLDPWNVMYDIKVNLLKNGPRIFKKQEPTSPLIGEDHNGHGSVSEEVIWECTTCGACTQVCPEFIEQFPKIIEMRRNLVQMRAKFPEELLTFFENMEQRSNPWGIAPAERTKWAAEIEVKPFDAAKTDYLFFVGCAGAFDARNRRTTLAVARILNAAGISWGILGKEENCCGDSLRRLGNEFVFDRLAQKNVKLFQDKGIKKIITQCPHCYSTLKNDYKQFGANIEVLHHTELISSLLREGKLKVGTDGALGNVVVHDSCYLGRHNEVYEPPRDAVAAVTGQAPTEMTRHHQRGFCCGAGGGRMWMEEAIGKRINIARVEEALEKAPKTICVACPYCMTMFEDGLKDKNALDKVQVLDVAEIVAGALK